MSYVRAVENRRTAWNLFRLDCADAGSSSYHEPVSAASGTPESCPLASFDEQKGSIPCYSPVYTYCGTANLFLCPSVPLRVRLRVQTRLCPCPYP